jgi:hypothetical protein
MLKTLKGMLNVSSRHGDLAGARCTVPGKGEITAGFKASNVHPLKDECDGCGGVDKKRHQEQ